MMTTQSATAAAWRVPESLADCRRMLATYEADLAAARAELATLKARAEQRVIDAAGGPKALGANAEDRARALQLALDGDAAYADTALEEQICQRRVLALRAEIQVHEDMRRGDELAARERLIDVLERFAPGGAIEDVALEAATTAARAQGRVIVLPDRMTRDGGAD